ncbi:MAG: formyltransferase family protein [Gemmatimonadaceae bacterium]
MGGDYHNVGNDRGMKLMVMAEDVVGLNVARWLLSNYECDVALVVTMARNEIFHEAVARGVPAIVFESDAQVVSYCRDNNLEIDLGLVVWWPRIIHEPLLTLASEGLINTHPSLLPYNRGKHYNFWALVEQAPFGVSLHFINDGIDCGDIVAQAPIVCSWEDSGETLFLKARDAMIELVCATYPRLRALNVTRKHQDASLGSFHLAKELEPASLIDLDQSYQARDLLNLLRARTFAGHPSCWFADGNDEFEVRVNIRRKVT